MRFFSLLILLLMLLLSVVKQDLVEIITLLALLAGTYFSAYLPQKKLAVIFFLITGIASFLGSIGAYNSFYYYDKVVHVAAGFASTYFAINLIPKKWAIRKYLPLWTLVLAVGLIIGIAWEFFEWASKFVTHHNLQRGTVDTLTDLLADVVGAFFVITVSKKRRLKKE